jgi:hypothetical protein
MRLLKRQGLEINVQSFYLYCPLLTFDDKNPMVFFEYLRIVHFELTHFNLSISRTITLITYLALISSIFLNISY